MPHFIDEVTINVRSGKGGDGAVSFRREKYIPRGGPDGGDGGDGGDVVFVVKRELRTLYRLKLIKTFRAEDGKAGSGRKKSGMRGRDCIIEVPPGTMILDEATRQVVADLTGPGDSVIVCRGGRGGRGNVHFATSTNRAPRYAQEGKPGSERRLIVHLKIIADAGIVGLPNTGKSTLLSVLTKARPRIGDYPFTTLYPNIGVMEYKNERHFLVADIPGIIEGAHLGHGLGLRFLKHVERTKLIVMVIDLHGEDFMKQYETILTEMEDYSPDLLKKPMLIIGSKQDLVSKEVQNGFMKLKLPFEKLCISSVTGYGIDTLKEKIDRVLEKNYEGGGR